MIAAMRSYQLCAGLFVAVVSLTDDCSSISAQELSRVKSEVATLHLHDVRAWNLKVVADLVTSIVPAERVVVIAVNRQLAVFATPSVQDTVAKRIADHEKNSLLAEAFDFSPCDPLIVWDGVEQAQRMQLEDVENELSNRLGYKFDASKRKLLVWGTESDIRFVESVVDTVVQTTAAQHRKQQVAESNHGADTKTHFSDDSDSLGLPLLETKPLPVPRGPIKIVHVKGLDLLLIRGR